MTELKSCDMIVMKMKNNGFSCNWSLWRCTPRHWHTVSGYDLVSQLVGFLVQTKNITLTPKPNETKLALVQVAFYAIRAGNGWAYSLLALGPI